MRRTMAVLCIVGGVLVELWAWLIAFPIATGRTIVDYIDEEGRAGAVFISPAAQVAGVLSGLLLVVVGVWLWRQRRRTAGSD